MDYNLEGKLAFVTGSTKGIGKATAALLLRDASTSAPEWPLERWSTSISRSPTPLPLRTRSSSRQTQGEGDCRSIKPAA